MATFLSSVLIEAPVAAVFAFHEREDALALLSPPFPPVLVLRRDGGIEVGSRVEMKIGPLHWVALHTAFEKNRLFEDNQISGPFARWVHRHEFFDLGDATRLTDNIDYLLPGGVLVNRLFGWAVEIGLGRMFQYRHRVTKLFCERGIHENSN